MSVSGRMSGVFTVSGRGETGGVYGVIVLSGEGIIVLSGVGIIVLFGVGTDVVGVFVLFVDGFFVPLSVQAVKPDARIRMASAVNNIFFI